MILPLMRFFAPQPLESSHYLFALAVRWPSAHLTQDPHLAHLPIAFDGSLPSIVRLVGN